MKKFDFDHNKLTAKKTLFYHCFFHKNEILFRAALKLFDPKGVMAKRPEHKLSKK